MDDVYFYCPIGRFAVAKFCGNHLNCMHRLSIVSNFRNVFGPELLHAWLHCVRYTESG